MNENNSKPFYMQEVDEDTPVLPSKARGSGRTSVDSNARFVDIGSIRTNPGINYAEYITTGKGLSSIARLEKDGSIVISLDLKQDLPDLPPDYSRDVKEFAVDTTEWTKFPSMNIVIMIVGSRGDVQPYVALGKRLRKDGHRIRIASHETFRAFVNDAGLEFFDIGGNPQDLMSYMVKNPGLMPGFESLTNGDIGRKRKMLSEMMEGCWRACHSSCPETGQTFAADAIISNPPAFAHVHCAEALGIPLLLSFTMPWTPTTAFPHPLVNIMSSNAQEGLTNYLSYALAEILTWQGIGDIVNKFRTGTLGLTPLSLRSGPGVVDALRIPWTYCMSPSLIPKPRDWKNHIDVVGFYFLDLATDFTPPDDLAAFLAAGEPPVYIGFGSVVVDDPANMTNIIFEATKQAGVRALVSAGWGGLGGVSIPSHVFILGNIPHDWLFADGRVAGVVHHGGAGTTAIGLSKGLPTVVVPFFGDQAFWGRMIHKAGAGPEPIPHKKLEMENLRDAIKFAISPEAQLAARRLAEQIRNEDGVNRGAESFYRHLPLKNMRCDLNPARLAVWWSTEHCLKLSALAAQTLVDAKLLSLDSLDLHRPKEYNTQKAVSDPVTGGVSAIFWTVTHYYAGIAQIFYSPVKGIIHTTTAIPQGVAKIVYSIHEGFQNVPKLYGSEVRQSGKVTDFSSGLKEAGKGLFYGYYDGITGLVREPWKGAQKEGFVGAVKGSARSFVNVTMRPAAGIVGLVAHPMNGAWKSVQSNIGHEQGLGHATTRISDGIEAFSRSSRAERSEIIQAFKEAKKTSRERQKKLRAVAEEEMYGTGSELRSPSTSSAPSSSTMSGSMEGGGSSRTGQRQEYVDAPPERLTGGGSLSQTGQVQEDDDAAFVRDLERAMQLSLVDQ